MSQQSGAYLQPISGWKQEEKTATRWASNHNWCYRGANTKYKSKK